MKRRVEGGGRGRRGGIGGQSPPEKKRWKSEGPGGGGRVGRTKLESKKLSSNLAETENC